jgi:hypothetical protein
MRETIFGGFDAENAGRPKAKEKRSMYLDELVPESFFASVQIKLPITKVT